MSSRISAILAAALAAATLACSTNTPSVSAGGRGGPGRLGSGASPVTVAKAEIRDVPIEVRQIGAVEAIAVIAVKAQTGGELTKVLFHGGDELHKGQQLFEIDPRPYEQAIAQAQASIEKDNALIAQAEANLARDRVQASNAKQQADRYAALAKDGLISKDQNDVYQTTSNSQNEALRADEAAINSAKAALNVDRAALETAKLNLSYCSIYSPIDGRAGSLLVQQGNLIKANDVPMVNINQIAPVFVTFSVPEQILSQIRAAGTSLDVIATIAGSPVRHTGKLTFIDNTVDTSTGTIKLKGTFPNADRALWPGQFVNVTMTLRTLKNAIVVPSEALQSGPQGQFIYVVKADQTVENRTVKPGQNIDNRLVIEAGITAGETVVTDGQLRLLPGARVRIQNAGNGPASEASSEAPAGAAGRGASL